MSEYRESANADLIPNFRFDTVSLRTRDVVDARRENFRPFGDVRVLENTPIQPSSSVIAHVLDDVLVTDIRTVGLIHRTGGRLVDQSVRELVSLRIFLSGSCPVISDNFRDRMHSGRLFVLSHSVEQILFTQEAHSVNFTFRADQVGYDPTVHPAFLAISLESVVGKVLYDLAKSIHQQMSQVTVTEAPSLAAGIAALVKAAINPTSETKKRHNEIHPYRIAAMQNFIESNINNHRLSKDILCQHFNISSASLYRMFNRYGGVQRYIMRRRLEHALDDLISLPLSRGMIHRTAERWGFYDDSHFRRQFRAQFGISPTDAVSSRHDLDGSGDSVTQTHSITARSALETYLRLL